MKEIKNWRSETAELHIQQSATVKLPEEYPIPNELLLSRLSYTHFVELLRAKEPLERLFYEVETIKNNWSVKELERAFDSGLYVRTGHSSNKEGVISKFKNQKPAQNVDVIRDPAQKRITFDNTHYKIDLVFYHRILKSHILIDLKIGKFTHSDAGQMTVYLNYYKDNEMTEGDNPPVGIILCGDKNETLVKYATNADNQMFVSKYLVKLPEKKALENFLRRELNQRQ